MSENIDPFNQKPVKVSPLIKGTRWSLLIAGILFGSSKKAYYQKKEESIRAAAKEKEDAKKAHLVNETGNPSKSVNQEHVKNPIQEVKPKVNTEESKNPEVIRNEVKEKLKLDDVIKEKTKSDDVMKEKTKLDDVMKENPKLDDVVKEKPLLDDVMKEKQNLHVEVSEKENQNDKENKKQDSEVKENQHEDGVLKEDILSDIEEQIKLRKMKDTIKIVTADGFEPYHVPKVVNSDGIEISQVNDESELRIFQIDDRNEIRFSTENDNDKKSTEQNSYPITDSVSKLNESEIKIPVKDCSGNRRKEELKKYTIIDPTVKEMLTDEKINSKDVLIIYEPGQNSDYSMFPRKLLNLNNSKSDNIPDHEVVGTKVNEAKWKEELLIMKEPISESTFDIEFLYSTLVDQWTSEDLNDHLC